MRLDRFFNYKSHRDVWQKKAKKRTERIAHVRMHLLSFRYCDFVVDGERRRQRRDRDENNVRFAVTLTTAIRSYEYDFVGSRTKIDRFKNVPCYRFDLKIPTTAIASGGDVRIAVLVMGAIKNDYGKRCWRNLGGSAFDFKYGDVFNAKQFRVVCNSGCGIDRDNIVSGIFQCRIRDDATSPNKEDVVVSYDDEKEPPKNRRKTSRASKTYDDSVFFESDAYFSELRTNLAKLPCDDQIGILTHLNATYAPSDYYWTIDRDDRREHRIRLNYASVNVPVEFNLNLFSELWMQNSRDDVAIRSLKEKASSLVVKQRTERHRLPLHSVVYRKTPRIEESFWFNALTLLSKYYHRTEDVELFCDDFLHRFDLGRKAAYASHLLTLFPQHLEYISDFLPQKSTSTSEKEHRNIVEEFSSGLINMSGDCEDSNTAIYQIWKSFRKFDFTTIVRDDDDARREKMRTTLRECQRVLTEYYVAFVCSDIIVTHANPSVASSLRKRTDRPYAGARSAEAYQSYVREDYGDASFVKNYQRPDNTQRYKFDDVELVKESFKSSDSAHICVKMLPKSVVYSWIKNSDFVASDESSPFFSQERTRTLNRIASDLKSSVKRKEGEEWTSLPVLFLEATSFLFPSDEEPSKQHVRIVHHRYSEKDASYVTMQSLFVKKHAVISDCVRIPYVFDKGFSKFYKGTAFVMTDHFKSDRLFTFSASSYSSESEETGKDDGDVFLNRGVNRGVSHGQLSYKTKNASLIPYASFKTNPNEALTEGPILFEDACKMQRRFDYEKSISASENPKESVRASPDESIRYNHLYHDSKLDYEKQHRIAMRFVDKCRRLSTTSFDASKVERESDAKTMTENEYLSKWCKFDAFIDPFYVREESRCDVLERLYDAFETIVVSSYCAHDGDVLLTTAPFKFKVEVEKTYVECRYDQISNDLGYWALSFYFKKRTPM